MILNTSTPVLQARALGFSLPAGFFQQPNTHKSPLTP